MSDFDLVVRGNIVDPDGVAMDGWLAVRDGKIAARGAGPAPAGRDSVDARGQWIGPGVVDGQVHSGSQLNQEGLGWASRARWPVMGGRASSTRLWPRATSQRVRVCMAQPPAR